MTRRLLIADGPGLAAHRAAHGPPPSLLNLIDEVERSGLTGRGGGGFPTARKLRSIQGGITPVVIANGSEGEPLASKDAALLVHAPHLVLDGLQAVSQALGARRSHVVTTEALAPQVVAALAERHDRHTGVVSTADSFIAGEESAVVAAVEGRPAIPGDKLRPVYLSGVGGRPTVVLNVETLAHVALIARHGADWFRSVGDPDDPGTFLATVGGAVERQGVYEVDRGQPLGEILEATGAMGGEAVLIGGYHGSWLRIDDVREVGVSVPQLGPWSASPGAGVVWALKPHTCGLRETARIARYLAAQTAGQCGPCVNGLPYLAESIDVLARRTRVRGAADDIARANGLVAGRGACRHPDGTSRMVASALRVFAEDVVAHERGRCLAETAR
jgi:NADH:ubiquinone oxidoreductase subunit F (NADH-binding)